MSSSTPATSTTTNPQNILSTQIPNLPTQPSIITPQTSSQLKPSAQTFGGISLPALNTASISTVFTSPSHIPVLSALTTAIGSTGTNVATSSSFAASTTAATTTASVFSQLSSTQTDSTIASGEIANLGQPPTFDFGKVSQPPPPYSASQAAKNLSDTSKAQTSFGTKPVSNSIFGAAPSTAPQASDLARIGVFGGPTSASTSTALTFGIQNTQTSNSAQSFIPNTSTLTFGTNATSTSTPATVVSQTFGVVPTQARQTPTFGNAPAPVSQVSLFGTTTSQANPATAFGIPPVASQANQTLSFGASTAVTQPNQPSAFSFGASTTPGNQNPTFGAGTATTVGASQAAPTFAFGASTTPTNPTPTFGANTVNIAQQKEATAFNFTATQPTQAPTFGSQPNTSSSLFGATQTSAPGIFGASQAPSTRTPVFGTTQTAPNPVSAFGTLQNASNQPSSFGTSHNTSFGVSQVASNQTQSFAFAGANQSSSVGVFGSGKDTDQTAVNNTKKSVTFNFGAASQGNTTPVNQGTQNMFNTSNSQTAKNLFGASKSQCDSTGVFALGQSNNPQTPQKNTPQNGFAFGTPAAQTGSSAVFAFGQNGTQQPATNQGFDFSAAAGTANPQSNFGEYYS